jgi:hypothetical protein
MRWWSEVRDAVGGMGCALGRGGGEHGHFVALFLKLLSLGIF